VVPFKFALVTLVLIFAAGSAQASAFTDSARKPFADHTLKYKDKASGLIFSIYLGRFGDFERYFPCQFDHGKWWVAKDGQLCIKFESKKFKGFCRVPKVEGKSITLSSTEGRSQTTAQFLDGNKTPFG